MSFIAQHRHDLAHILASAVQSVHTDAQFGIGPETENGFYYDFKLSRPLTTEDLPSLEKKMRHIMSQSLPFVRTSLPTNEAIELLTKQGQMLKVELAKKLQETETEITFYRHGDFIDMCKGPHSEHTNQPTKHFMLTSVAGAYWLGDSNNEMLQRVYGVAFETKEELEMYKKQMAEAKKRDHRVLGKKLGLFSIESEVGLGLPLWKPKGAMVLVQLQRWFEQEQLNRGYIPVKSPHIGRKSLWETSGHWGFYNESMYPPLELGQTLADYQDKRTPKETETYLLKPMNCPFHMMIYNTDKHSYRDLPKRMFEFGTVYRYEQKGELGGLTRVRGFTQDDAHIICTKDQLNEEFSKVVDLAFYVLKETFGFDVELKVSLRDPENTTKYLGSDEMWNVAEATIQRILDEKNISYEKETGEAAFYGPKADFKVRDAIGRLWQLSTVQFDFNLPERFNMVYTNDKGEEERPFVVHRALFGSFERFMGILIEHFEGAFPFWLAPEQVRIFPVADVHMAYAETLQEMYMKHGIRSSIVDPKQSLAKRIRTAEMEKIPYTITLGDEEIQNQSIALRKRSENTQETISKEDSVQMFLQHVYNRSL